MSDWEELPPFQETIPVAKPVQPVPDPLVVPETELDEDPSKDATGTKKNPWLVLATIAGGIGTIFVAIIALIIISVLASLAGPNAVAMWISAIFIRHYLVSTGPPVAIKR